MNNFPLQTFFLVYAPLQTLKKPVLTVLPLLLKQTLPTQPLRLYREGHFSTTANLKFSPSMVAVERDK